MNEKLQKSSLPEGRLQQHHWSKIIRMKKWTQRRQKSFISTAQPPRQHWMGLKYQARVTSPTEEKASNE